MKYKLSETDLAKQENFPFEQAVAVYRNNRNVLLSESDAMASPDYPHPNEAARQQWVQYRQALRDAPASFSVKFDERGLLIQQFPAKPV